MTNYPLGFSVPFQFIRREEIDIFLGIVPGYESIDCVRFVHYQLPDILESAAEKVELGSIAIPLADLPFVIARLLDIAIEHKSSRSLKIINEQRLEWLLKKMDEFKAIQWNV